MHVITSHLRQTCSRCCDHYVDHISICHTVWDTAPPHRQRRVWHTCTRWMRKTLFINHPPLTVFEDEIARFGGTDAFVSSLLGEAKRITAYGVKGDITPEPGFLQIGRIVQSLEALR